MKSLCNFPAKKVTAPRKGPMAVTGNRFGCGSGMRLLPVIALKILGFVSQSREHPKRVRALGLLYTLGVIVSFLVLAAIVIGVKAAGQKAGWGMQFSSPQFIVILTVIVALVAL